MRILKYIFLIILLISIGLTVYIITQKGNFEITKSSIIKTQKNTVFDYVNDYKNWESFGSSMIKDNSIEITYPSKTIGSGAYCSWSDNYDKGDIKTVYVKESDSIVQKVNLNGAKSEIRWLFKDTLGGTKVTIHGKGEIDLATKFSTFFKGGITAVLEDVFSNSLQNLDKTLKYEMKTYSIKVNGVAQRNSGYCLKQTVSCKIKSVSKNIKIIMPKMISFFKKNKLPMLGKPYVIFERYDTANDIATISVCIPVSKQINVMPGSDITSGEIEPFTCLKTTLIGDYSHRKEAWDKAKKYIQDNDFKENLAGKYIEIYTKTIDDIKSPSKWVTEIYIPVFPKAAIITPTVQPAPPSMSEPIQEPDSSPTEIP